MGDPLSPATRRQLFNYAGFQAGWFLLVLTRSPWALLWVLAFLACHALWVARPGEWQRVLPIMLGGLAIDLLWQLSPWVTFIGTGWPLPLWLFGLWLMFPLTLNHSLAWLDGRPLLQVLGGVFGAGGSYLGGAALGAAEVSGPALVLMPLGWALWLPLFYRWNRYALNRSGAQHA